MEIRKALPEDKNIIRKLWEYCFNDSKEFLDHYFTNIYSSENTVTCIEDNNITTTLQLNPCSFQFLDKTVLTNYIVGISSFPESRGSGAVKKLFQWVFNDLYNKNMPFAVLMAVDYGLYRPYSFNNIQDKYIMSGKTKLLRQKTKKKLKFNLVTQETLETDSVKLSNYLKNNISNKYSIYIHRDPQKFKNNLLELFSDKGFACYTTLNDEITGYFLYYFENTKFVVKELFYNESETLKEILQFIYNHNTQQEDFEIRDDFYKITNLFIQNPRETDTKIMPFLMARVINLKEFLILSDIHNKVSKEIRILFSDEQIKENNIIGIIKPGEINYSEVKEDSSYDISIDISLLSPLFFGTLSFEEAWSMTDLYKALDINNSKYFMKLFAKKEKIFFNEYV